MSQTSSDSIKVTNEINITRTLTGDRRKSKNQKNYNNLL